MASRKWKSFGELCVLHHGDYHFVSRSLWYSECKHNTKKTEYSGSGHFRIRMHLSAYLSWHSAFSHLRPSYISFSVQDMACHTMAQFQYFSLLKSSGSPQKSRLVMRQAITTKIKWVSGWEPFTIWERRKWNIYVIVGSTSQGWLQCVACDWW